jgi:MSHA pilin protein MshA
MKKKNVLKNEKGFTLIEIIAVIIIMGILAAVAVPRFFSMQEDAKIAALNGGLSEAAARFNHAFAKYILVEKRAPADAATLATADYLGVNATTTGTNIGDFTVTWKNTAVADEVAIEIVGCTPSVMTAATLAAMDEQYRKKVVSGITWGS